MATMKDLCQLMARLPIHSVLFLVYFGPQSASTIGCVCPGDTLTYECTVTGGILTIWTGTAFECPSINNEILLLHDTYGSVSGSCNNGDIVARSLSAEGNNYTSQLNVTITPETAGKTIECFGSGFSVTLNNIFSSVIPTITDPLPPNTLGFSNVDLSLRQVTLSWSPSATDCPAIHYNILASNCGSCPTTTKHTNVTCTDTPNNGSTCTLAVQTVVCGNTTGNMSDPIRTTLYAIEPMTTPTAILRQTETEEATSGNMSDPIRTTPYAIEPMTTPTAILRQTETEEATSNSEITVAVVGTQSMVECIASISSLATALMVSVAIFTTVIVIILKKSKAKITAALESSNRAEGPTQMESVYYEEIPGPVRTIDTQDNIAYSITKTSTAAM